MVRRRGFTVVSLPFSHSNSGAPAPPSGESWKSLPVSAAQSTFAQLLHVSHHCICLQQQKQMSLSSSHRSLTYNANGQFFFCGWIFPVSSLVVVFPTINCVFDAAVTSTSSHNQDLPCGCSWLLLLCDACSILNAETSFSLRNHVSSPQILLPPSGKQWNSQFCEAKTASVNFFYYQKEIYISHLDSCTRFLYQSCTKWNH